MQGKPVPRERLLDMIRPVYDADMVKVLTGPRGSGKSVVLSMIADEVDADEEHRILIDFEDPEPDVPLTATGLLGYLTGRMTDGRYYLFLDEIQNVEGYPDLLASLLSTGMCSVFVTSSNGRLLQGEHVPPECRMLRFEVLPFSYSELREYVRITTGSKPTRLLPGNVLFSGYPQGVSPEDGTPERTALEALYRSVIEKDVLGRYPDTDIAGFEKVASFVLANCCRSLSAEGISDRLGSEEGFAISAQSVRDYLDVMEDVYLLKRVPVCGIGCDVSGSSETRMYALDNGFRYISTVPDDLGNGSVIENAVYLELLGRGYTVCTGRTNDGDIDFVVSRDGRKCLIQVAYLLSDDAADRRVFGALSAVDETSPKYVISLDVFDCSRDGVTHLNLLEFLLGMEELDLS